MAVEHSILNYFSTTLTSNVGAGDLTFPVSTVGALTSPAYIVIDPANASKREVIDADGTWGASSFVASALGKRGLSGSASGAQAHDSGTTVVVVPLGQYIEDIWDVLDTLTADHGGLTGLADDDHTQYLLADGTRALSGTLSFADNIASRPVLKDYGETKTAPSSSAAALTLDLENGNVFEVTLTESVTTLTISNPPATGTGGSFTVIWKQDGTGGWAVTHPASVKWAGGTAPTLTSTPSAIDVITYVTTDGGTTWYGFVGGQAFA